MFLAPIANISLPLKNLAEADTLAYSAAASATKKTVFVALAPDR
jgi:hypothetical protein